MTENEPAAAPSVRGIVAAALRVGDVLQVGATFYTVTSARLQGAPPEVSVEFAGLAGRRHYLASAIVIVRRPGRRT